MNQQEAVRKGYHYTGIYKSFAKEEIKQRCIDEFKKKGFKAVVVVERSSQYSRGGTKIGYSIYAEQLYFDTRRLTSLRNQLNLIPNELKQLTEQYNKSVSDIAQRQATIEAEIVELANKGIM